ncbi:MAG: alpha/beta fold hydrolase, partial [Burkholderiaceae bacterium]
MATEVILPRVDMDMTEGKIALWHVKDGDRVSKGQVLFEMETDKATMEVEADADGVIQGISGSLDTAIPVGQVLAWILREGESLPTATTLVPNKTLPAQGAASAEEAGSAQLQSQGSEATEASKTTQATEPTDAVEVNAATLGAETPEKNSERILRATPLARAIAREQRIDLRAVQGSGEAGRIYAVDVKQTGAGKRRKADVNADLHLHWFARNGSNTLVMLHGFGSDLGSWRPLVGQMSGLSLLGIDLPNHGKSARSEVADFETLARMLVAKLDDEGVNGVHLLGHSMGGAAALAMAGLLGPRLRSLTLVAPAGFGPEINGAFIQ